MEEMKEKLSVAVEEDTEETLEVEVRPGNGGGCAKTRNTE